MSVSIVIRVCVSILIRVYRYLGAYASMFTCRHVHEHVRNFVYKTVVTYQFCLLLHVRCVKNARNCRYRFDLSQGHHVSYRVLRILALTARGTFVITSSYVILQQDFHVQKNYL